MIKLTAVIITLNEEKNIGRCIKSLIGIADEIIVVDSFSTDKTEDICIGYNIKFFKRVFKGFSDQKNWGIAQSTNPYIISIDADEALSDELRTSISEIKNNWVYDAYTFNLLTNYMGRWIKHCGWYPEKKLRIWDSRKGLWIGEIHERINLDESSSITHISGLLLHYTCYTFRESMETSYKYAEQASRNLVHKNGTVLIFKSFVNSFIKFMKVYFLKLGILDGIQGLFISVNSAYSTFIKYSMAKYYKMYGLPDKL
jgi:glycosyltransferase involved in cell wall biosynthesis